MFCKRWITKYQTNQNIQQYITLASGFVTEFMSITISSLALWFIPQSIEYMPEIVINYSSNAWYVILLMNMNLITLMLTSIIRFMLLLMIILTLLFYVNAYVYLYGFHMF